MPLAFEAVSPRVFVLGKEAGVRQALDLLRSPLPQGPLAPVIERCRQADHVVFGYNPAAGRIDGGKIGIDLSALNDVDVFLGTLNIREQIELEVRARTDSKVKAGNLLGMVKSRLSMAKTGLAFAGFMPGKQGEQFVYLNKLLREMKLGVDALRGIYERTELFVCNKEEAERILKIDTTDNIHELLNGLQALGPKIVVITNDRKGAYVKSLEGKYWFLPMYPDTRPPFERTGAGDAFASSVAAALGLGLPLEEALLWGPINSMSVVQEVGAQKGLLTREKLEELLRVAPPEYKLQNL